MNQSGFELAQSIKTFSPKTNQVCDNCKNNLYEAEVKWKIANNKKAELCLDCLQGEIH